MRAPAGAVETAGGPLLRGSGNRTAPSPAARRSMAAAQGDGGVASAVAAVASAAGAMPFSSR